MLHLLLYIVYLISYHCPSSTAYINQMQENLHALKLELEKGTIGTNVSEDGKARLETCVMSCVATFVFGEANQQGPKKFELKLTCGDQQSSTNGPSVEMSYIQTDVPNRRKDIPQLGTYLDVQEKTLACVINGAREAIDKDSEKTVGNRGKDKVKD